MEGAADTLVVPDLVVLTVKINDLDPLLADAESIMKGLRARAIDQAEDKAASLAAHVGNSLGAITGLHVNEDPNPFRRHQRQMDEMAGNISGPEAQLLSSRVRVNFETY